MPVYRTALYTARVEDGEQLYTLTDGDNGTCEHLKGRPGEYLVLALDDQYNVGIIEIIAGELSRSRFREALARNRKLDGGGGMGGGWGGGGGGGA